ncbi:protein boule-like isoform X2 [Anneissia japonica]|uniref:protein boule-like isoform X2 n=1 Tax=Anneissia japonica TaxID=1529436 RepID=UPI0014254B6A|nr:protein boule-like isoform X2 [Anneissia japonica]
MADQNSSVTDTCSNSSSPVPLAPNAPKYGTVIPNRIFVGGISFQTNDVELENFFSSYGQVKEAKIITDRAGISKGYGFITFENADEAVRIIKEQGNNLIFKDKKLNIGPAIRKQPVHYPKNVDTAFLPNGVVNVVQAPAGFTYTYLNGVAYFNPNEVGQTPLAHPSAIPQHTHSQQAPAYAPYSVPVVMSHAPPQYMASQPQSYAFHQASPATNQQWTSAHNQWRWIPQSTGGTNPAHHGVPLTPVYSPATPGSEVIYSAAPHYHQPAEVPPEMSVMDSSQSERYGLTSNGTLTRVP